jgi:hypothetical protein
MPVTQLDKGNAFRALHHGPRAFIIPNAWDAGSTRILAGRSGGSSGENEGLSHHVSPSIRPTMRRVAACANGSATTAVTAATCHPSRKAESQRGTKSRKSMLKKVMNALTMNTTIAAIKIGKMNFALPSLAPSANLDGASSQPHRPGAMEVPRHLSQFRCAKNVRAPKTYLFISRPPRIRLRICARFV